MKNLDKNGDGLLSPDEFGKDDNARILEGLGTMAGNRDGTVDRQEWLSIWGDWTGKPALTAVRMGDGATAWSYTKSVGRVSTPLVVDGLVYMVANGGILTAVDAVSGEVRKAARLTGALDNYFASPVVAGGRIYLTSESGKVVVVKPGPAWEVVAVNDLGEECYATPALSGGRMFLRTASALYAFGGGVE